MRKSWRLWGTGGTELWFVFFHRKKDLYVKEKEKLGGPQSHEKELRKQLS